MPFFFSFQMMPLSLLYNFGLTYPLLPHRFPVLVVALDLFRLVAFNLGYLPGGDKTMITRADTTLLGLEAAERILAPGGLISLVVYVGHPGGR